jgi:hypothetical protein
MAANHKDGLVGTASSCGDAQNDCVRYQAAECTTSPYGKRSKFYIHISRLVPWALLSSPSSNQPFLREDLTTMDQSSPRHTVRSSSTNFTLLDAYLDIAPQDYLDQGPAGNPPMFDNNAVSQSRSVDSLKLPLMNQYTGEWIQNFRAFHRLT